MTQEEYNALLQLIQRIPLNQAEALWLAALLRRLSPVPPVE